MLESTPLAVSFSIDGGASIEGSCAYSEARPLGDFLATTLVEPRLRVVSVYLGSGEFDCVPALHKISDPERGNGTESGRLPAPDHTGPAPGSVAQLLYDHLAVVQAAVAERRGERLAVEVDEEDVVAVQRAGSGGLFLARP